MTSEYGMSSDFMLVMNKLQIDTNGQQQERDYKLPREAQSDHKRLNFQVAIRVKAALYNHSGEHFLFSKEN